MVTLALRMFEDGLCRCGHSMQLTQAEDGPLAYRSGTRMCYACAAAERDRETGPGKITYIEDLRDIPGAMDPDADDVRWMPPEGMAMDVRYQPGQSSQAAQTVLSPLDADAKSWAADSNPDPELTAL